MKKQMLIGTAIIVIFLCSVCAALAQELKPIVLPEPNMESGKPLMQVLKARSTSRDFSDKKLSRQQLADLLWAAFGVNRPETGKRTAPSAMNWREIDLYVALEDGLFIYDAKAHSLQPVLAQDIRAATGIQAPAAVAPVNLVYVADFDKIKGVTKHDMEFYSATDTGFIAQNVYLYCASEGLNTFVRGLIDKPALSATMNLRKSQKIILAQSVGFPK